MATILMAVTAGALLLIERVRYRDIGEFPTVGRETRKRRATSAWGQPASTSRTSSRRVAGVRRALRCATRGPSYRWCLQHTQQQAGPLTCNNLRRRYS